MKTLREYIDILKELEAGAAQPAAAGKAAQPAAAGKAAQPAPAGKATQPAPAGKATQPAAAGAAQPAAAGKAAQPAAAGKPTIDADDVLRKILGQNYEQFMDQVGKHATDTKFIAAIQSLHSEDDIELTPDDPMCIDLTPMQKEIDAKNSLPVPLTNAALAKACLAGGPVTVNNGAIIIVTAGDKKYIVDGHHRWSKAYVINPKCRINAFNINDIRDPFNALKSVQLGIVSHTKQAPKGKGVEPPNLMDIGEVELKDAVKKIITADVLEILRTNKDSEVPAQKDQVNQPGQSAQQQPAQQQPAGEGVISGSDEEDLKNQAAKHVWKNVQLMQTKNKAIDGAPERIQMPQTDKDTLKASPGDDTWSLKMLPKPGVRAEAEVRTDKRGVKMKTLREYIDIINANSIRLHETTRTPSGDYDLQSLKLLMSKPLIVGPYQTATAEAPYMNLAQKELKKTGLYDDELWNILYYLSKEDPDANIWANDKVAKRMEELGFKVLRDYDAFAVGGSGARYDNKMWTDLAEELEFILSRTRDGVDQRANLERLFKPLAGKIKSSGDLSAKEAYYAIMGAPPGGAPNPNNGVLWKGPEAQELAIQKILDKMKKENLAAAKTAQMAQQHAWDQQERDARTPFQKFYHKWLAP